MSRRVDRYVDRLLRRRRPKAFTPTEEDLAVVRTAIDLTAARPDADQPRQAFVDELHDRLAQQQAAQPQDTTVAAARPLTGGALGRRRVLQAGAVAACAFAAGYATDRLLTPGSTAPTVPAEDQITPRNGVWQTVAASTELADGAVRPFDLGAVTGFVHRASGRLRAVSGICTHQACRLDLNTSRDELVCPCHGATFAVTGEPLRNLRSPHPLPALPRLAVREYHGDVQVYAPAHTTPA